MTKAKNANNAAAATNPQLRLAYADANSIGRTTWGGVTLTDTTNIVVGVTVNGDANIDGKVNALDFNAVAANFGATNTFWTSGDFNYDGTVNTTDFTALTANYGGTTAIPAGTLGGTSLGSVVPEPASLSALALLGLVGRRRRR